MRGTIAGLLFALLLPPFFVQAQNAKPAPSAQITQDVKTWALKTAQYKEWLDQLQGEDFKFWLRIDGTRRPHKLYVSEGFTKASFNEQEQFVEIFSHYLAGHPDKYMLIDLYDAGTGQPIGEYGFGGFKLFRAASDLPPDMRTESPPAR